MESSTESEYKSMFEAASNLAWIVGLLHGLHTPAQLLVSLACYNKAAQYIVASLVFHNRTKYLDVDCNYVRDRIQEGFTQTVHVSSYLQFLSSKLGLVDPSYVQLK